MLLCFRAQILHIHIALVIAGHRHHTHARHHGAGWIGAVGTRWDQANISRSLATGAMPGTNHEQPCVFALRSGIGLERHTGKPGECRQPGCEVLNHPLGTLLLIQRSEGMHRRKLPPTHRHKL